MSNQLGQRMAWVAIIGLIMLVIAASYWLLTSEERWLLRGLDAMAHWVEHAPILTAIIFLLMLALSTALTLPTVTVLTITAGFLFGSWLGTILSIIWALCGAAITFIMVRRMAGDKVRNFFSNGKLAGLVRLLERDAFFYLMGLRIVPVAPFFALNAAGALIRISLTRFLLATGLGLVPIMIIFAGIGAGLETLVDAQDIGIEVFLKPKILLPLLALAGLIVFSAVMRLWMKRRREQLLGQHSGD